MTSDPHDHPARIVFECVLIIFVVCGLARILLPADPPVQREIAIEADARRCIMHYTTRYTAAGRPVPVRYHVCTVTTAGRCRPATSSRSAIAIAPTSRSKISSS